jgi:uncharacterized LabA/DUF88 family protein
VRSQAKRRPVNLLLVNNTIDLALAVDVMDLACQTPRLTVMVTGSGDADFLPAVVRRQRGVIAYRINVKLPW